MKKEIKKITEKFLTEKTFKKFEERFESSARTTANSFADTAEVLKNLTEVTATILKEIRIIHEDNKYFRQSISGLNFDGLSYDRKMAT